MEDQVLSVNFEAVEIKEFRNTVTLFSGTFDGGFYHFRCHIVTVGEFYALTDLEGPCFSIVTVFPLFRKTWNDLTVLIEFCKALADRITGYNPAEILLVGSSVSAKLVTPMVISLSLFCHLLRATVAIERVIIHASVAASTFLTTLFLISSS